MRAVPLPKRECERNMCFLAAKKHQRRSFEQEKPAERMLRRFWRTGDYLPGLKLSFRLTARLKTRAPGLESLLSAQK